MEKQNIEMTIANGKSEGVGRSGKTAYCFVCKSRVVLLTTRQAESKFGLTEFDMIRLVQMGALHRIHNSSAQIRYCFDSLKAADKSNRKERLVTLKQLV